MSTANRTKTWTARHWAGLAGLLLVQFAAAYIIGTGQWLTNDQHLWIPPIGITAMVPVTVFLLGITKKR